MGLNTQGAHMRKGTLHMGAHMRILFVITRKPEMRICASPCQIHKTRIAHMRSRAEICKRFYIWKRTPRYENGILHMGRIVKTIPQTHQAHTIHHESKRFLHPSHQLIPGDRDAAPNAVITTHHLFVRCVLMLQSVFKVLTRKVI